MKIVESTTCNPNYVERPCVSKRQFTLQEKVAIFQNAFQGRDDVFAKRWYSSTTQKSGYQPVCEREWNRDYCDKRKYKCADCPNRQFAPLTYNDYFNHLAGKDAWERFIQYEKTTLAVSFVQILMTRAVSMVTRMMCSLL